MVILLIILLVFLAVRYQHGETNFAHPVRGYPPYPRFVRQGLKREFHLGEPWYVEYLYYIRNVATFHFGPSYFERKQSAEDVIRERVPVTLTLAGLSLSFALLIGVPLGVLAALRPRSLVDDAVKLFSNAVLALPLFTIAALTSYFFATRLGRYTHLPAHSYAGLSTWPLPAFALGLAPMCYLAQLIRTALLDALRQNYIRTARAKGLRRRRIVALHALRIAFLSLLRTTPPLLGYFTVGIIFTEWIFDVHGLGYEYLGTNPGPNRLSDWTVLMAITILVAVVIVAANLLVEAIYAVAGPRIREAHLEPRIPGPDPARAYPLLPAVQVDPGVPVAPVAAARASEPPTALTARTLRGSVPAGAPANPVGPVRRSRTSSG